MTPREFLTNVVRPNVVEFHQPYDDMRHAHNAISAVDALAAHVYVWCLAHAPHEVAGSRNDSVYRAALASQNADFGLLRDTAKAQKHAHLTRGDPKVSTAAQVNARLIGWGEGPYGGGRYGGAPQVVVDLNSGGFEYVERIVDDALNFLDA
jgi:hypothetical protein